MTDRPRCGMCSKLIRPHTERIYAPTSPRTYRPVEGWTYTGNKKVVARGYDHLLVSPDGTERVERYVWRRTGTDIYDNTGRIFDLMRNEQYAGWTYEKLLRWVSVWDGETYLAKDGFFCSGPCAGTFARKAFEAGYRIQRRSAA